MIGMASRRAFVVGAYIPNGGTVMAYHLGRILEYDFGFRAIAVVTGNERADAGVHVYDLQMPSVSPEEMVRQATDDDVVIVNPSFSEQLFGWRSRGFKISYVQHFNTFPVLDLKLDHFVACSDFVAGYLRVVYGINPRVIPPFINLDRLPLAPRWWERPEAIVLPFRKGMPAAWNLSYLRLHELVTRRAPQIILAKPIGGTLMPQHELLTRIAGVRYLLTLSAAEGFGLVPLEAMALGTVVIGYDGFGGRHYMRPDKNCAVAPYPEIERVCDLLLDAVSHPETSAAMAVKGQETAARYSYEAFRNAWIQEFSEVLSMPASDSG
jgi:glycosyltransferase involved in cell wall biosynthesis